MSMFLSIDTSLPSEISSNVGWGDFARWVGTLGDFPELTHLATYGWTEPVSAVRDELNAAMKIGSPSSDVAAVGKTILGLLSGAPAGSAIVVGNGMSPSDPASESRSSLIRTTVTDKNGVTRHVWVHPDEEASPAHESTTVAVLPDLAKQFPQEAADPKLWEKVTAHAKGLHEAIYGALVRATPNILSAAHAILHTPEDFAKFGFAPTLSGLQHAPVATDPIREATGLGTHLVLSLASKVLSHGFIWAKGRMKTEDMGSAEEAAQWIGDLLVEIAKQLGVDVQIDREAILRAVVEKAKSV